MYDTEVKLLLGKSASYIGVLVSNPGSCASDPASCLCSSWEEGSWAATHVGSLDAVPAFWLHDGLVDW